MQACFQRLAFRSVFVALLAASPVSVAMAQEPTTGSPPILSSPAPSPPAEEPTLVAPSWARYGSFDYPQSAFDQRINEGRATLGCAVLPQGQLTDCQIIEETPPGAGFGFAARRGARTARVASTTETDSSGRVRFTVIFRSADPFLPLVPLLEDPEWWIAPAPRYPRSAGRANIGDAYAVLNCGFDGPANRLRDCRVKEESVPGHGFGTAAIQSLRNAQLAERLDDVLLPDGRVIVRIAFEAPPSRR